MIGQGSVTGSVATGEVGFSVDGILTFLGLTRVSASVEFTLNQAKEKTVVVKIVGANDLSLSLNTLLRNPSAPVSTVLALLGGFNISNPAFAFAFATAPVKSDDQQSPFCDSGISDGLNFYGTLDFRTLGRGSGPISLGNILRFITSLLHLDRLTAHSAIAKIDRTVTRFSLEAIVKQDLRLPFSSDSLSLTFRDTTIGVQADTDIPPDRALSVSNTLILDIPAAGANQMALTGTINTSSQDITAAYTITTPADRPWHPFGFNLLSVGGLAVTFGATFVAPWVKSFGIAGQNIRLDTIRVRLLAIMIDVAKPKEFVFALEIDRISIVQLLHIFAAPIFAFYNRQASAITDVIDNVIDVSVQDVKLHIVLKATQIGDIPFNRTGISFAGRLSAWGWGAAMDVHLSDKLGRACIRLSSDHQNALAGFIPGATKRCNRVGLQSATLGRDAVIVMLTEPHVLSSGQGTACCAPVLL